MTSSMTGPSGPLLRPADGDRESQPPSAAESLRSHASTGGRYGLLTAAVEQATTMLTTMILARLLSPRDFGLVAAATLVCLFFQLVTRFGFGPALIRRQTVDARVVSSLLLASVGVNTLVAVAALPLAGLAASAVGAPEAAPFVALLLILLPLGPLASVPRSLLLRRMRFRMAYAIDIAAALVYASTAVTLAAAAGWGVAAVVTARLLSEFVAAVAALAAARVSVRPGLHWSVVREETGFSSAFLVNQWMGFGSKNLDYWTVSQVGGPGLLGIYYIAYVIPSVTRQRMNSMVNEVLFPTLARIRDDPDRLVRAYLDVLRLLCFIMLPVLVGIAVVAPEVIAVFYGARWEPAAVPMAIIALAAAVECITQVSTPVLLAFGPPRLTVHVNVIRLVTIAIFLGAAARVGTLTAVATAVLAATAVTAVASQWLLLRLLPHRLRGFFAVLTPPVVCVVVMAGVVVAVDRLLSDTSAMTRLAVLVPVGALAYVVVAVLGFRRTFRPVLHDVRRLIGSR